MDATERERRFHPLERLDRLTVSKLRLIAKMLPGTKVWDVRKQAWRLIQREHAN